SKNEDSHLDQPSSSHSDPNVTLLQQVAAQQELVTKHAREVVEQQVEQQRTQPATASSICPKEMVEAIETALLYIEAKVFDKMPYTVTLSEQIIAALKNEVAPPTTLCATPYRNRMRNITQDTFVCLHHPQPMFVLQKKNLSMYSNWQQDQVSPQEASLIQMYFKAYSTKPRMGTKELYRFTVANKVYTGESCLQKIWYANGSANSNSRIPK
uniref:Uncharacterized protein n=1 Tax=Acrobeloides nanus TaxID=290746 RepID=A0A914EF58_9BILA